MISSFQKFVKNEEGSAVIEFVILALPLFIPLFLYLSQYSTISDHQSSLRTLGREMARGFVSSENDEVARRVTNEIFLKGSEVLGLAREVSSGSLSYTFECKSRPCISPDNEIVITINSAISKISISTVEFVSPWA